MLVKSEVRTQLDLGAGDARIKTGKNLGPQKSRRNVVEGSLEAN